MDAMELFQEASMCMMTALIKHSLPSVRKVVNRSILTRRCPTGCIHHQWDYLSQFFLKLNWTWIPSVTVACTWYRSISLDVLQE
ncbi:hypothetical protein T08_2186 [Trichinella sp. T8]|nr:hypothetical protein T08_2186 [Trichinella sp. T8]